MATNGRDDEDISVSDPDDYTTRQRLKQIYEARRDLRDMRREASEVRHSGGHRNKTRAVQHYRSAVESYLLEIDTLIRKHDPGPYLWNEKEYGTVTIRPPGDWEQKLNYYIAKNLNVGPNRPLKVESMPEAKEVPIVGLSWLFTAESPVTRQFEFEAQSYRITEPITKTAGSYIAWTQLNEMVTDVNHFLGEMGIGLETDETDEWTI